MANADITFYLYLPKAKPFIEAILKHRYTQEQAEQAFVESMQREGSTDNEEYLRALFVQGYQFEREFILAPKAAPLIKALTQKSLTQYEAEEAFIIIAREMGFVEPAAELIEVFESEKRRTRINGYLASQAMPFVDRFFSQECTEQEARQFFIQYMRQQGISDPDQDLNQAFGMACYYASK